MAFKEYSQSKSLPEMERDILKFWSEKKIFERSVEQNKDGKPFVFFEGPPTANGKPGIHHVLSRVYKDIYIRYYTQQGYYVPRRAGWDCHGLPVEREVEKKLGITTKTEIEEKIGLEEFNRLCRESIMTYVDEWNTFTERMGFWIDLDDAYYTLDNEFIESVWGLLKIIWEKDLIYQGYKVVPYDPVMGATLSDAEVGQGYKTVKDPSLTVRFELEANPLKDDFSGKTSFLVWTTTPWTLSSNVALALAAGEEYLVLERTIGEDKEGEKDEGITERLILAAPLKEKVLGSQTGKAKEGDEDEFRQVGALTGKELTGIKYKRLQDWVPLKEEESGKDGWYTVAADFVTMDAGTGIVHIAPAFGVDDLQVGQDNGLPVIHGVGLDGKFIKGTPYAGTFFKDADIEIIKELKGQGSVWKSEKYEHEYPFGYRTGAPLLYYAKDAWYIRTTDIRQEMIENNNTISWTPENVKDGRFGKWLENNRDWALSRERFWGTPLPLWTDGEGTFRVIGSVKELEELSGQDLKEKDLHLPGIDEVEITDPETGKTMKRVPEVIDCWFDSGAMPYAQWGSSAEGKAKFETAFPADFITEAVDQTRGWFYTLLAISTMVSGQSSYKSVICLGHVVDGKGEKMSKSKGNTVDPNAVFDSYGADALRWYFLTGSPPGNSRRVGPPGDKHDTIKVVLPFIKTLMNSVGFFTMYAGVDGIEIEADWENNPVAGALPFAKRPDIDRWILSSLQKLIEDVSASLDKYDSYQAGKRMEEFTESLSNWYIRRNRRRFWKGDLDADKKSAYDTLYRCLTTLLRLMAPFTPFLAEDAYKALVVEALAGRGGPGAPESVHMTGWPAADLKNWYDAEMLAEGDLVQQAASLGRAARAQSGVKVRQPLARMMLHLDAEGGNQAILKNKDVLLDELNVKELEFLDDSAGILDYRAKPNLPRLGKRIGSRMREVQNFFKTAPGREIARKVKAGEGIVIAGDNGSEDLTLEPEDVLIESVSMEGSSAAEGGGILVVLDTNLNEELLAEGLVRDVVRQVQELRKNSGLEVVDRIELGIEAPEKINSALNKFQEYIENETLASLNGGASGPAVGENTFKLDGEDVKIQIWKSSAPSSPAREPVGAGKKKVTPAEKKPVKKATKKKVVKKPVKKATKKKVVKKPVKKATKKKVVKKPVKKATKKKVVKKPVKKTTKKKVVKKPIKKKSARK